MSSAAWSALADRFAAVAADGPVEFETIPLHPPPFADDPFRTRVLLRFRSMPTAAEELYTLRADGSAVEAARRVGRFRWLCWAAGVLFDPHGTDHPREAEWLRVATGGRSGPLKDVVKRAETAAKKHVLSPPPARHASPTPVDDWKTRTVAFALLRERFVSTLFHGSLLRLKVGQHDAAGEREQDRRQPRQRSGSRDPTNDSRFPRRVEPGGVIEGEERAVGEFVTVSESAHRLLPAELTTAFGPPLFPPAEFAPHVGSCPTWERWAVVMWLVLPAAFDLWPASDTAAPFLTLDTTPELTAAAVCERLAAFTDPGELVAYIRRRLATNNPWLDSADREAALLAVGAAHPATARTTAGEGQPTTAATPGGYQLTQRQEELLLTMLEMEAVGSAKKVRQVEVVRKWWKKANPATCKRDFGALKGHALTESAKGPKGGIWLTPRGKTESEWLRDKSK